MFFRVNISVNIDCLIRSVFSGVSMDDFSLLHPKANMKRKVSVSATTLLANRK